MQFNQLLIVAALTTLAVATPTGNGGGGEPGGSKCNTGPIQCCNTVTNASNPACTVVTNALGITIKDLTTIVGLTCSPVTGIGNGNAGCNAHPVCCDDNSHGTLISIGCVPVDL